MYRVVFIIFLLSSGTLFAHEPKEGDLYVSLSPIAYRTLTASSRQNRSPVQLGAALVTEGDLGRYGGLEIGLFYMNKYYVFDDGRNVLYEKIKRAYITTGYRHWLSDRLSAGLAIYSAYSMGDVVSIHEDRRDRTGSDVKTSARSVAEYGLDGSILFEWWRSGNSAVFSDLRYGLALPQKKTEEADHIGLMFGVKYLVPKERLSGG